MRLNRILTSGVLAAATVSAAFAIPATDPAPRYNFKHAEWWYGRFDKHRALATKDGAAFKIAFCGDSITENWEGPGTNVWNRVFRDPKYMAVNLGYGGDKTEHLLWRLTNGEADGISPKVVVLLIGTNNTFSRNERDEPVGDTARSVAKVLGTVRSRFPHAKVILNAILPANERPDDEKRLRDARISEQLRALADGENVLWCNFGEKLLEPDGTLTKAMSPDLVHPGERGYEIWLDTLMPYLDWCLGYSDRKPSGAEGRRDGRADFWQSAKVSEKRDEIVANTEHFYDYALLGDLVTDPADDGLRRRKLSARFADAKVLDFPFDFSLSVRDLVWAVENGGLCDGYSAKVLALSGDLWRVDAAKADTDVTLANAKRLLESIRRRQPQAKVVLMPAGDSAAALNEGLRALCDGERFFWKGCTLLPPCEACIPTPRADSGWLERFASNRRQIAASKGAIDIVLIGDSITHYWDVGEGPDCSTEIVDLRKTYSILNCGYGGDMTQNQLWCAENGLLDGYAAKLVMIHIGTNNSGLGAPPAETFAGIKKLVATVREKQPQAKILLLNIFPRGTWESKANTLNRKVNQLINAEKWDDAVIVKDIGSNFVDEKGDTISELFDDERLHFTGTEGYARWRKAVEPVFRDVVDR